VVAADWFRSLDTWVNLGMFVALVGAAVIFGRAKSRDATIAVQTAELDAREKTESRLREDVEQLRGELLNARARCSEDIARLQGQVAQLTQQNETLQSLVMGSTVPPALQAAIDTAVTGGVAAVRSAIEDAADRGMEAVSALLAERGSE